MRTVKYDGTRDYGTEAGRNRSTEGKAMAVKRHVNTLKLSQFTGL